MIHREFSGDKKVYEAQTTKAGDIVVIIDTRADDAMRQTYVARKVISRVQKLRKTLGLRVGDEVEVFYKISDDEASTAIEAALKANMGMVEETIRTTMVPLANLPADASVLGSEIFDIADGKIELTLKSSNVGVDDITVKLEATGTN